MRLISKAVLSILSILSLGVSSAQAEIFHWQAEDNSVSVTFPDRWARIHNQRDVDLLTVKAPGDNDNAVCTISARDDERFKIYPAKFADAIQREQVSDEMWELHFDGQARKSIHKVYDNAQLDEYPASMVSASYDTAVGPKMRKRALAFAALYGTTLYSVECSSLEESYDRWHNSFLTFIKAVDIHKTTNNAYSGYYRDFIADVGVKIKGLTIYEQSHY